MKMTDDGLALIKRWEGFRAAAYRDAVGVWTIGYGHTAMAGEPQVKAGLRISEAEGEVILRRDVEQFARGVRAAVKAEISDAQFSALVSFAYNVGLGNFRSSSVLAAVNRKDFAAVPRRLQLWSKAGGRVLPGLVKRRADEAALFSSGSDDVVQPAPVEKVEAKPVHQSRTLWSAVLMMLMALLQAWVSASLKLAGIALLLLMLAAVGVIVFERLRKMKEEAV
jgi:lysozyme